MLLMYFTLSDILFRFYVTSMLEDQNEKFSIKLNIISLPICV